MQPKIEIEAVWDVFRRQEGLRGDVSYVLAWAEDEEGVRCVSIRASSQEGDEESVLVPEGDFDDGRLATALEWLHAKFDGFEGPEFWI